MRASLEWAVAALSCLVAMMAVASEETAGVCTATGQSPIRDVGLTAAIRVLHDDGASGSIVRFVLNVPDTMGGLPDNWQLCFTWLKATVLRHPHGTKTSGSYVQLPARDADIAIATPAMRHISDLPQGMHVVVPLAGNTASKDEESCGSSAREEVFPVTLLPPAGGQIRFDGIAPRLQGVVPRPVQIEKNEIRDDIVPFLIEASEGYGPVHVLALSKKSSAAAVLLDVWLRSWPASSPIGAAEGAVPHAESRSITFKDVEGPDDAAWFGNEGYELQVVNGSRIEIHAAESDGFHRACATLQQLFGVSHHEGQMMLPPVRIRDRPAFEHRGVMLDVARHFFPVSFIKQLLDWMYLYKLNVFHWHLTDDEGWRLEIRSLPELTAKGAWRGRGEVVEPQYAGGPGRYGGFYTQEEVKHIVQYAADRGITIVPEIDVPGHCYAAIRSLPDTLAAKDSKQKALGKQVRSVQGFQNNVLHPGQAGTYEFLEKVFTEVLELFPAPLGIHIGMDEVPAGVWSSSQAEEEALKVKLLQWLQKFLKDRGTGILGWEEAFYHDGGLTQKPGEPSATALAWKEDERFAVTAANKGFDIVLCPAHFLYLDIVQGLDFEDRGLYWATTSLPLDRVYSYEPMARLRRLGLKPEAEKRIRGVQTNLWSETVSTAAHAEELLFPRLLAAAEVAWTDAEHRSWNEFQWRVSPHLTWLVKDGWVRHHGQVCGMLAQSSFLRYTRLPDSGHASEQLKYCAFVRSGTLQCGQSPTSKAIILDA